MHFRALFHLYSVGKKILLIHTISVYGVAYFFGFFVILIKESICKKMAICKILFDGIVLLSNKVNNLLVLVMDLLIDIASNEF